MTDSPSTGSSPAPTAVPAAAELPRGWLSKWPWVTFLAPMVVYMLVGSFEPKPPESTPTSASALASEEIGEGATSSEDGFAVLPKASGWMPEIPYRYYPQIYTAKILLMIGVMALVWPGYCTFPFRMNPWSIVVGMVGVVLWILLCRAQLEQKLLAPLGLDGFLDLGERSAFNPLEFLAETPRWAYVFLAIRFVGLAGIVPVMEEFFLRGFLMRYVVTNQWWKVPVGQVTRLSLIVGTAVPMLMHPGELVAAAVWFSLVTWWMIRTRNIWDCVVVHAVTNLLLGVYVVWTESWELM